VTGFFFGVGIFFSFIFFTVGLIMLIKRAKKSADKSYDEKKLLTAFAKYSQRLQDDEQYNAIPEVKYIIQELAEGYVPEEVHTYEIKRKSDVALREADEQSQIISVIERYVIIGKKKIVKK
jgi:hypothetical protein